MKTRAVWAHIEKPWNKPKQLVQEAEVEKTLGLTDKSNKIAMLCRPAVHKTQF